MAKALPVREVERTSVSDAVRAQLQELIESGHISVGEKLPPEQELARSFGVSRPVVREALGTLRAIGLVSSRTGRGTFVSSSRPSAYGISLLGRYATEELHEVRSHLEIPGAALAAERRTPDQLARLRALVDEQERCEEPEAWVKLDVAFHVELAAAAANRVHVLLVESMRELLVEQSLAVARIEGRIKRATDEHRTILAAVSAGNARRSRDAMARHLERIRTESHQLG